MMSSTYTIQNTPVQSPSAERLVGRILSLNGAAATVAVTPDAYAHGPLFGTFLQAATHRSVLIGVVTELDGTASHDAPHGTARLELVGELPVGENGLAGAFRRGVSIAPCVGGPVQTIRRDVLERVHQINGRNTVRVGRLHQDPTIPAAVEVGEMLGKHFAIVGSTGTGKSCTVALILRKVLADSPNAHIILLDPHNEYGECFDTQAERISPHDLHLPYWVLSFEEFVEIVLGDARMHTEEIEVLRDLIPQAKAQFASAGNGVARAGRSGRETLSVDVPVPYRIADVLSLLENEMGRLEKQKDLSVYKRVKSRLIAVNQDPRYDFMFGATSVQDTLKDVLQRLFRIPARGRPITIIQLMGLPSEVINVIVSVVSRLAFDLAIFSRGQIPVTVVCEEAHRYVPANGDLGFEPTKRSISRIAKEGRKYGASICIVSQRPGDLDPTILSQCSTVFAMRLSNERDQEIIDAALSDSSASLLRSLPLLGTREAIVFGEAFRLPSRIVFDELEANALPRGMSTAFNQAWQSDRDNEQMLDSIIREWRQTGDGGRERRSNALGRLRSDRDVLQLVQERNEELQIKSNS